MTRVSLTVLHLLLAYSVYAQNSYNPSIAGYKISGPEIVKRQTDSLYNFYIKSFKSSYGLVNGKEYHIYYFKSIEKPILLYGRKHHSSLILNGRKFDNVWLDYDTYLDELLYSDSLNLIDNKVFKICMNKDPVNGFIFCYPDDTLRFSHMSRDSDPDFNLPEGFYEVVYSGKSNFIIGHRSELIVRDGVAEYIYVPENYIMTQRGYSRIRYQREFLDLFGDRSGEIKKFMKINRIHYRKSGKNQIAAVLRYYDNLNLSER
jgi:hypothetical protein